MDSKKFYTSKTFWFNVAALVVVVINAFGFADFEAAPEVGAIGAGLVAVINLVLRVVTDKKISI
jgi:hypothetical protein